MSELVYHSLSDIGLERTTNQDAAGVWEPPPGEERERKGVLFIVADGMGGHSGGAIASSMAVDTIRTVYSEADGTIPESLELALVSANESIYQKGQKDDSLRGMGTTATALVVRGREAYLAHVGDSRAYLVRAGEISQITKDHSLVEQMIEDNLLSRESAENHPYSNIITRSLGPKPAVAIDVNEEPFLLVEGDVFLLCSDGLTKMVPDERILELAQLPQPREAALRLVEEAKKGGGLDNITVLVVRVARLKPQDEITQIKQPGKEKPRRIRFWGR